MKQASHERADPERLQSDEVLLLRCPVVSSSLQHMDCSLPGSSVHEIFPGKNTGVGCHLLLQGLFPAQGSNPRLFSPLHWQEGSLHEHQPGSPRGTDGSHIRRDSRISGAGFGDGEGGWCFLGTTLQFGKKSWRWRGNGYNNSVNVLSATERDPQHV